MGGLCSTCIGGQQPKTTIRTVLKKNVADTMVSMDMNWFMERKCFFVVYNDVDTGEYSYLKMGRVALGARFGVVVQSVVALYAVGSTISFVVLTGDFLTVSSSEITCNSHSTLIAKRSVPHSSEHKLVLSNPGSISSRRSTKYTDVPR